MPTKDPFVIYNFYDLLEQHYTDEDAWNKLECTFNLDETSVQFDPGWAKVIVPIEEGAKHHISDSGKESITALTCVSDSGCIHSPRVLFAAKSFHLSLIHISLAVSCNFIRYYR